MLKLFVPLALAALVVSTPARSFIDPPVLTPSTAMAGQTVFLQLRTGICDAVLGGANNPAITSNGPAIDVLIDGSRRTDPLLCMFNIVDHRWALGAFEPGDYSVTVRFRYTAFGLPQAIETLGVLPLAVEGQPAPEPRAVPAIRWPAVLMLILMVAMAGAARRIASGSQQ